MNRNSSFRQLILTERSYVEKLNTIVKEYLNGLKELAVKSKNTLISEIDVSYIFNNIDQVLEVHEKLLEELERVYIHWPEIEDVGECILPLVEEIHTAYCPYVRGFRRAIDTLTRVKAENPKLAHAILDIQHRILSTSPNLPTSLPSTLSSSSLAPNPKANSAITLNNLLTYPLTRYLFILFL